MPVVTRPLRVEEVLCHFTALRGQTHLLYLTIIALLAAAGFYMYRRSQVPAAEPRPALSDDRIKQEWRKLGFFCELDDQKKTWTLTGSRAGLLYFPDLLLGYVADPAHAGQSEHEHYGPYGSLEVMTWPDAGFDGHAIRGSLMDLGHLAELVEAKLASAQPGEPIRIREEFAPSSPYSLVLDVRADGFDPASADGERLGAIKSVEPDKRVGDKPAGDKPAGDKPAGNKPAGNKPAGNKPAGG